MLLVIAIAVKIKGNTNGAVNSIGKLNPENIIIEAKHIVRRDKYSDPVILSVRLDKMMPNTEAALNISAIRPTPSKMLQ